MGKTIAEEREALTKIREILECFDPEDTYIGKAFEGCVEQADENLSSDFMMSYKGRYDNVSEQLHAAKVRIIELTKTLNQKDDAIARLEDAKDQLSGEINRLIRTLDHKNAACTDLESRLAEAKETADDLRQTILELKAKLYDMMTAGGEVKG